MAVDAVRAVSVAAAVIPPAMWRLEHRQDGQRVFTTADVARASGSTLRAGRAALHACQAVGWVEPVDDQRDAWRLTRDGRDHMLAFEAHVRPAVVAAIAAEADR